MDNGCKAVTNPSDIQGTSIERYKVYEYRKYYSMTDSSQCVQVLIVAFEKMSHFRRRVSSERERAIERKREGERER